MAIEIVVVRRGDKLIPVSPMDWDELQALPAERPTACKLWAPRTLPLQRFYRGMVATVAENTDDPRWNEPNKLHAWLKIRTHFVDEVGVIDGKFYCSVKSTSFTDTDEAEFKKYLNAAIDVIAHEIWPSSRPDDWIAEIVAKTGVHYKREKKPPPPHNGILALFG